MKLASGTFRANAFLLISKSALGYRNSNSRNCQQIDWNINKIAAQNFKKGIIIITPQKGALMDKLEED